MAEERRKKKGNLAVWLVLGLLILALGGFGIGGFGGSLQSVATVGDEDVTVQDYARALEVEQRRIQQQTGQALTVQQMQLFGLDRQVMDRLLARAALAHESGQIGVSVGDAAVAAEIRANPAFGGIAGDFDREGYAFALRQVGLSEREFEAEIRQDAAQALLQRAVTAGASAPDEMVDRLVRWVAETRDLTFAPVTPSDLSAGPLAPSEDDLQSFYDDNQLRFEAPERKRITYAWITPDRLAGSIEVDEAQLRETYEARIDSYRQPARVLAERLAFADDAAADAARTAIDAGETTFDALVEERGLTLADVDQGELAEADLSATEAEALFGLAEPGLVGPIETSLGPALYRVNAILNATETTFEEVHEDLSREVILDTARRRIQASRDDYDDLLAGGATLEDLVGETEMELGETLHSTASEDEIARYDAFRAAARAVEDGDFPEIIDLADGGVVALRLDEVIPAATPPLDDIRAEVEAAWRAATTTRRLTDRAEELAGQITLGAAFDAAGLRPETAEALARDGRLEGTPPALIERLFAAEPGDVFAVPGDAQSAWVVRLDGVNAADLDDPEVAEARDAIEAQAALSVAQDLFQSYGAAIQAEAGFSLDQQAIQAVQSQMLSGGAPHGGM
ncbi:MAG: SurA N-terminal domain-containing protein [Pseudomonadota bacterium]